VQLNLVHQSIYEKENRLYVYISDYSLIDDYIRFVDNQAVGSHSYLLNETVKIRLRFKNKSDERTFLLNASGIIRDTWGAHLVLENESSENKVGFIEDPVELTLMVNIIGERSVRSYDFPLKPGSISF
jgi:hypothetical protein